MEADAEKETLSNPKPDYPNSEPKCGTQRSRLTSWSQFYIRNHYWCEVLVPRLRAWILGFSQWNWTPGNLSDESAVGKTQGGHSKHHGIPSPAGLDKPHGVGQNQVRYMVEV